MLFVKELGVGPIAGPQRGVTALELLLALVATFLLAALGASMYRTYSVRAQIVASMDETGAAKSLIVAAFQSTGVLPANAAAVGIDESAHRLLLGTYLDSLEVHEGRLDLRFGRIAHTAIAGKVLSLTPFETADRKIVWVCGKQEPGVGLQPLGFADGGRRTVQIVTSIEDRYLPRACR